MLKIGLDAMGGDFAPEAAVKGAVMASAMQSATNAGSYSSATRIGFGQS